MKILFFISFISLNYSVLFANDNSYPIKKGEIQIGIFQPVTYGAKHNIDISSHPLLFFIKPNISIKKFYKEFNGIGIANRYSAEYPTPLLKILQRDGIGGLISEDPTIEEIPNLIVLHGEWLLTKIYKNNITLTTKLGFSTCIDCNLDKRLIIDYDIVYPRMVLYHYNIGTNIGADLDYIFSEKIYTKGDFDILLLPKENLFFEHKFIISYRITNKYTLSSGYKFTYGHYPINKEKGLINLFPIIDITWHWSK